MATPQDTLMSLYEKAFGKPTEAQIAERSAPANPIDQSQAAQVLNQAQGSAIVQPLPQIPQMQQQPTQGQSQMAAPVRVPIVSATSAQTQGIDEASKAGLTQSGARERKVLNDQINYIKDLGKSQTEAKAQVDKETGTNPQDQARQLLLANEAYKDSLKEDMRDIDSQIQNLKDFKFKDFWADKTTGSKIGMALSVGLGAFAQGLNGGNNIGLDLLKKAMDDDFRLQQSNYERQVKNIELSKLSSDQKAKLFNAAEKSFQVYNAARTYAVESQVEQIMKEKRYQVTPQMQEMITKLGLEKERAAQNLINQRADKIATTVQASVPVSPLKPDDWRAMATDKESPLGAYNKAVKDYETVQNFKKSGNFNASVINLVSNGLDQGSYNPDNFDPTSRSLFEKVGDKWKLNITGAGDEQIIVKAAEKFFKENALSSYQAAKTIIPSAKAAGIQHGVSADIYVRSLPKSLSDQASNFSELGLKPAK